MTIVSLVVGNGVFQYPEVQTAIRTPNPSSPRYRAFVAFVLATLLGVFNPINTAAATTATPVAPTVYATSRPAHQYTLVNRIGPNPRPSCPQLRKTPSLLPRSSSLASKLVRALRLLTTVADVTAKQVAAAYRPRTVVIRPSKKKDARHAMTPMRTESNGGNRRVTPPCKMEATKPMYPSSLPLRPEVNPNSSYVMKDSELSMPEKNKMKKK